MAEPADSRIGAIPIDWVALQAVPGLRHASGALGMTSLPGVASDASALRNLHAVDTLLLLVEDRELERAHVPDIAAVMRRRGIELLRHPIVDMGIPVDVDAFRDTLGGIHGRLEAGRRVAVACLGGLGRTGTAVACLLVAAGLDADAAITLTRATRAGAIENTTQVQFVRDWAA